MTGTDFVDRLAQEIRRVDGNHDKGAAALAEAISHFFQGESLRLFGLLADIRKAAGDPEGKLMQDELVARIAALKAANDAAMALVVDWRTRIPPDAPDTTRIVMREWCADQLEQALGKGEK